MRGVIGASALYLADMGIGPYLLGVAVFLLILQVGRR